MTERKALNIVWHPGKVTRACRERLSGHRGFTIWFTGLSASGKSRLAVALEEAQRTVAPAIDNRAYA